MMTGPQDICDRRAMIRLPRRRPRGDASTFRVTCLEPDGCAVWFEPWGTRYELRAGDRLTLRSTEVEDVTRIEAGILIGFAVDDPVIVDVDGHRVSLRCTDAAASRSKDPSVTSADIESIVRRVVADVFGSDVASTGVSHRQEDRSWSVTLSVGSASDRTVVLRASPYWFTVHIPEHDVGAIVFDEDDDGAPKEAALRAVSAVARAWLEGEGTVRRNARRFRRGECVRIVVATTDGEWVLGRNRCQVPSF